MEVKKKIVLWCGSAANQKALANKLNQEFQLDGIVIEERKKLPSKRTFSQLFQKVIDIIEFRKIYNAWFKTLRYYDEAFPSWPYISLQKVSCINSSSTKEFTANIQPDLIIVSGTSLIKEPLLNLNSSIGIINLHTGLSPYVKGGPNCTNWCIANNDWHLVGNTIMWIDAGIDTGNLIATATTDIRACKTLADAHIQVMNDAHRLCIQSIQYLFRSGSSFQGVPQTKFGKGKLFLTKHWTAHRKRDLLRNWQNRHKADLFPLPEIVNIPLE